MSKSKNNVINIFQSDDKLKKQIKDRVDQDAIWAESQDNPKPSSSLLNIYSDKKISYTQNTETSDKIVLVDAINHALQEELSFNDKLILYGQDIAGGKGGVFTATRG